MFAVKPRTETVISVLLVVVILLNALFPTGAAALYSSNE